MSSVEEEKIEEVEESSFFNEIIVEGDSLKNAKIVVSKGKRKRASIAPKTTIQIVVEEDGEEFIDRFVLKSKIPFSAFKVFQNLVTKMPKNEEGLSEEEYAKKIEEDGIEFDMDVIGEMVEDLSSLLVPMISEASFTISEEEIDSWDDDIKMTIMKLLFDRISMSSGNASKK